MPPRLPQLLLAALLGFPSGFFGAKLYAGPPVESAPDHVWQPPRVDGPGVDGPGVDGPGVDGPGVKVTDPSGLDPVHALFIATIRRAVVDHAAEQGFSEALTRELLQRFDSLMAKQSELSERYKTGDIKLRAYMRRTDRLGVAFRADLQGLLGDEGVEALNDAMYAAVLPLFPDPAPSSPEPNAAG